MSEPPTTSGRARGIVVAHGGLAEGLVDAVRQIAGVTPEELVGVPNRGRGFEDLCARTRDALAPARNVIFTDLPSGSCHLAAMIVVRELPEIPVVTGVNLPMLLDFVFNRGLGFDELVPRLAEKARDSIGGNRHAPPRP
ncbi:MAG: hypothetical protein OXF01_06720 [Gemmatimonadetes bacterium]|nr:hypothetical protein [Gemmatimonadota bacterium]